MRYEMSTRKVKEQGTKGVNTEEWICRQSHTLRPKPYAFGFNFIYDERTGIKIWRTQPRIS